MANVKFSDFAVRTTVPTVDYIVGYQGADNIQIAPTDFLGDYLPLAGGTMIGTTNHGDNVYSQWGAGPDFWMVHNGANTLFQNESGDLSITNNADDADIIFQSDDGAGGVTPYLTIDGGAENIYISTDVGIGTATPGEKLHVSTDSNTVAKFESTDGNANIRVSDTVDNAHLGTDAGKTYIGPDTATGGNNITILSGGDVGIGTASPIEKLDVDGAIISTASNTTSSTAGANRAIMDLTSGGARLGHFRGTTAAGSGSVKLYSDSVLGITLDASLNTQFEGNIELGDGQQLQCGPLSGGDLKFYWDTTDGNIINKTGHLYIKNQANDKNIYLATDDGAGGTTTYIKCDGLQNYTEFPVNTRHMDNIYAQFGNSNDANIYHNGTDWYFTQGIDDGDMNFRCDDGAGGVTNYFWLDGGVELTRFSKGVNFGDNVKLSFGDVAVPGDLEIYHDTSNSYIRETGTGNMYIQASERIRFTGINDEALLYLNENSNVEAYYDAALKLETTATGTKTTGQMDIAALNTAPANAADTGTLGEIRYTADYIYVCVATDTWKRSAISTW